MWNFFDRPIAIAKEIMYNTLSVRGAEKEIKRELQKERIVDPALFPSGNSASGGV